MSMLNSLNRIADDLPVAAGKLGTGGGLMLVAIATWWLVPLAKAGWKPTDPLQTKPTEVWRPGPGGTATRVSPSGSAQNNAAGNAPSAGAPASGGAAQTPGLVLIPAPAAVAPAVAPAPAPAPLTGAQKMDAWAVALGALVQVIAPPAPPVAPYRGSSMPPVPRSYEAPRVAPATPSRGESFPPRGGHSAGPGNSRAAGPASGRPAGFRPAQPRMYGGGMRGGFGGFRGAFGGGFRGFSGGGGRHR